MSNLTPIIEKERKMRKVSVRLDDIELDKLKKLLGQSDDAKAIRGAINFTNNVAHNMFGGNIQNMFKRRKDNEEIELFTQEP